MSIPSVLSGTLSTSDSHKIAFDHYQHGHTGLVVIAHGFFNSKQAVLLKDLAQELYSEYDVILLDFRGHGKSTGVFTWTSKESLDLSSVLEYAREKYKTIGVVGFSLGAAISIAVAAQSRMVDSLIAVSAPVAFEKIEYYFWQLDFANDIFYNTIGQGRRGKGVRPGPFWLKKPKPLELAAQLQSPTFYIHGENDWLIKPWHSKALYEKTKAYKNLSIIKNGPHAEYLMLRSHFKTS